MSHQKLVYVYIGDSDPYTAAKVNHNICMAIGYYFAAELITRKSCALKWGVSTLFATGPLRIFHVPLGYNHSFELESQKV